MGKIFLQKYTLTFNQYNRHIGYHNNEIKIDGEGEGEGQEKKSIWQNKITWIVLAILVVVFAILGVCPPLVSYQTHCCQIHYSPIRFKCSKNS